MRLGINQPWSSTRLREFLKTIRSFNILPEQDGYYHIEMPRAIYDYIVSEDIVQELIGYMTLESRQLVLEGKKLQGLYGATLIPYDPDDSDENI